MPKRADRLKFFAVDATVFFLAFFFCRRRSPPPFFRVHFHSAECAESETTRPQDYLYLVPPTPLPPFIPDPELREHIRTRPAV